MRWEDVENDDYEPDQPILSNLLPSSLKEIWDAPNVDNQFHNSSFNQLGNPNPNTSILPGSAPTPFHFQSSSENFPFLSENDNPKRSPSPIQYYQVLFKYNKYLFQAPQSLTININDYVLTEADRGFDIGMVVLHVPQPNPREIQHAQKIIRLASPHEIAQLNQKAQKEEKALALCQNQATRFGLPMTITGAEYQFDGKKLTFYYTASNFVDFRDLVRSLFKLFGTRIWLVWHDGNAPVRGVLIHSEQN